MKPGTRTPAELRNMFGENLRILSKSQPSISELSRRLGINRTQFNRYLSGESFPRPDVLDRICNFFDVDARILLEPVGNIPTKGQLLTGPQLHEFFYPSVDGLSENDFPSGIYRFSRRSFLEKSKFVVGLVCVYRRNGFTYVRGYEAKEAILQQGLPADPKSREFRGYVSRQDEGVAMVISRRNAKTCSFNYLSRIASFENNFWVGYVTRTVRESSNATRATRMVYEHLGSSIANIVALARQSGMVDESDLQPFHKSLLKPDEEFC